MLRPGDWLSRKQEGAPLALLTAWDAPTGAWVAQAGVDAVLVGDSLAMVALGHATTLPVTLDEMLHHCRAVGRGVASVIAETGAQPLLICDLPFLSYQCSADEAVASAGRVLKESPAAAVKLEGAEPETLVVIDRLVRSGIPVMGHLGLTPQSVHQLGYRRQATDPVRQERLERQAQALQQAGCFALVIEHVPAALGQRLQQLLAIPVIGIGAGPHCDGQVLVTADLLGMSECQPPFAKPLVDLRAQALAALRQWVRTQRDPTRAAESAAPHCSDPAPLDR